jgi:hypothetical protein
MIDEGIDEGSKTTYYIAKMSKKYDKVKHLSGKGEDPVEALLNLEEALEKYIEEVEQNKNEGAV